MQAKTLFNPSKDLAALKRGQKISRAVLLISQNCPACRDTIGKLNLLPQTGKYVQVMDLSRVGVEDVSDPDIRRLVEHYLQHGVTTQDVQRLDAAEEEPLYELPALVIDRDGTVTVYTGQDAGIERLVFERLTEYP